MANTSSIRPDACREGGSRVDGLFLALELAELGFLGEVAVDDRTTASTFARGNPSPPKT
jgi:hypothetical protein